MPDTPTTNFGWIKPEIGGSDDTWGTKLNAIFDAIDAKLKTVDDAIENLKIKVGDLYLSTDATDPATKLGYGVWAAHSEGRALVGVGTADSTAWAAGQLRGVANQTITVANLPAHAHTVNPPNVGLTINSAGNDFWIEHRPTNGGVGVEASGLTILQNARHLGYHLDTSSGGASPYSARYSYNGKHVHSGSVDIPAFSSANTGSGTALNNIQPSMGVYVWRRVS